MAGGLVSGEYEYDERFAKWKREDLPIIPEKWKYQVLSSTAKQYNILTNLMNAWQVSEIWNCCDSGREGELIFRLVYNQCGCGKPVRRLWISSMEESAIRKGLDNLRDGAEYDCLYQAAVCRSHADWLVGINATRLFSLVYPGGTLNVGRVMTPACPDCRTGKQYYGLSEREILHRGTGTSRIKSRQ